ncbi:MAG: tryptophan 2,3-dioxygenase [Bacteroidetes bacterium]|nr:MAG: tryptophan 2,3-dioxygenase [Bacteroidota bacterium]
MPKEIYYGDYLQLNKILDAQQPESALNGNEAHDEMLFIIVHQAYELWFKQMAHEMSSIIKILSQPEVNDNSPDIFTVVHRLKRIASIWGLAIHQIDVIETMTPLDFLDFRDDLRPASGFQSYQFKALEAMMGLKFDERHGQAFYKHHLRPEHIELIAKIEAQPSLMELLNKWLERMPFFNNEYWSENSNHQENIENHPFWQEYITAYKATLSEGDESGLESFFAAMIEEDAKGRLTTKANRSALFIMLYRDFPLLQIPFQLLDTLIEIDDLMAAWRTRHISMVKRMIGARTGTGGSAGADYLKESRDKHLIFSELASINSFLIQRNKVPNLPDHLQKTLGFSG